MTPSTTYQRKHGYTKDRVVGIALSASLLGFASCASVSEVNQLKNQVLGLERRVNLVETKPAGVERGFMFTYGNGYDEELRALIQESSSRFRDPTSRKSAEFYANAVIIVPTNDRNAYNVLLIKDDGNKKPGPEDKVYPDKYQGKEVKHVKVPRDKINPELLERLIRVGGGD